MFNLTVSEAHTFYVGQNGWLVHNAGGSTVTEIYRNPTLLWGKSPQEVAKTYDEAGYSTRIRPSTQGSKLATIIEVSGMKGKEAISQIQIHPGGGSHGGAYIKLSTSTEGIIKVVDSATYVSPRGPEKALIMDYMGRCL